MNTLAFCFVMMGYGVGLEGVEGNRVYLGAYTPTHEYGWVMEDGKIWLDVVMEKNEKKSQDLLTSGR